MEIELKERIKIDLVPEAYRAMRGLQMYVNESGLDPRLRELVNLRASQMNGCAFCIAMHVAEARKLGEHDVRMHLINVWRETPIFDARERAAFAWTEAVTALSDGHVPNDVYEMARAEFSEQELVDLTYGIVAINGWNRLCIAFRALPQVPAELIQLASTAGK
jgi:AhpD family alkylhydroperoxidase